ncbi:hypothetical protein Ddye_022773 [Dipteronia dyeriana]|uniref:Uncharacterized protein n=1 Tax=Dipteronia dyeriana TaxID=168575 RepID=A0AAD9WSS0_9ROSI|nr:hypothetical protein Ddye_022773 [Dipteronia dyeriana]
MEASMLGIFTQGVSVEEEQSVTHLGQIQTQEDVSGAAQIFRCRFFSWYDPPICARSKKNILELLRRIRDLEMRLGEENGFEGIGTSSTCVRTVVATVDDEVSSARKIRKQNGVSCFRKSIGVLALAIGILFVVVNNCL